MTYTAWICQHAVGRPRVKPAHPPVRPMCDRWLTYGANQCQLHRPATRQPWPPSPTNPKRGSYRTRTCTNNQKTSRKHMKTHKHAPRTGDGLRLTRSTARQATINRGMKPRRANHVCMDPTPADYCGGRGRSAERYSSAKRVWMRVESVCHAVLRTIAR